MKEMTGERSFLVLSTILSTTTFSMLILILPLLFVHVQKQGTLMMSMISDCREETFRFWKEIPMEEIDIKAMDGVRMKRNFLPNTNPFGFPFLLPLQPPSPILPLVPAAPAIPQANPIPISVKQASTVSSTPTPKKDSRTITDALSDFKKQMSQQKQRVGSDRPLSAPSAPAYPSGGFIRSDYYQPINSCCSCRQGPPGAPGKPGKDGLDGKPGHIGADGRNGKNGEYIKLVENIQDACQKCPPAAPGLPGPNGVKGLRGQPGLPGVTGVPGTKGQTGPLGPVGPPGPPGDPGYKGVQGDTGNIIIANVPGPAGPAGNVGPRGRIGPAGRDGLPGEEGEPGARGYIGERGNTGEPGSSGPPGPPGTCSHCPTDEPDGTITSTTTTTTTQGAAEDPYQQQTIAPLKVYGAKMLRSRHPLATNRRRMFNH